MLQPIGIGHVVLKVRDLDRALAFYRDLLGFRVSSEMSNVMIFLTATGQSHHDLALLRVGDSAPSPTQNSVGLYHVAIQLADWEAVKRAHGVLAERGLLKGTADHGVTKSLYTSDPDGNEIELLLRRAASRVGGPGAGRHDGAAAGAGLTNAAATLSGHVDCSLGDRAVPSLRASACLAGGQPIRLVRPRLGDGHLLRPDSRPPGAHPGGHQPAVGGLGHPDHRLRDPDLRRGRPRESMGIVGENFDVQAIHYLGLVAGIVLTPPAVAAATVYAEFHEERSFAAWLRLIPVSYPATVMLGASVLQMVAVTPFLLIQRWRKKRKLVQVPLVMHKGTMTTTSPTGASRVGVDRSAGCDGRRGDGAEVVAPSHGRVRRAAPARRGRARQADAPHRRRARDHGVRHQCLDPRAE